jgi:serine/threonine-protein kinase
MEFIAGESLSSVLRREGALPVEDTVRIGRAVCAALGHAHNRGLVHRDMKPGNVLFDADTKQAKVVDFGIAKGLEDTGDLTRTSGLIGTAAYLSPEQVSGKAATPASDVYAVGCLLYACLTGEPPFAADTAVAVAMKHLQEEVGSLRQRRPDVPPELEAVIMHALEKDPVKRFHTAQEMDVALHATGLDTQHATAPTVVQPRPVDPTSPPRARTEVMTRPAGRRPTTRTLAAITAFLLTAAVAALIVLYLQNKNPAGSLNGRLPSPTVVGSNDGSSSTTTTLSPSPSATASPVRTATPARGARTPGPFDNLPVLRH